MLIATSIPTSTRFIGRFGRPLVRITIDFHDNEVKQNTLVQRRRNKVAAAKLLRKLLKNTASRLM
jgi:hypothetical protein